MKKIAINGFGRIGRLVFRQLMEKSNEVKVVAINDLTDARTLAHLLKYDSSLHAFPGKVEATEKGLIVNGKHIPIYSERDPENLPWGKLDIDIVVESTGFFRTLDSANKHIKAGAKKVLISAPASGTMKTIVYSVNHNELTSDDKIASAASCTTNCLAPIVNVLDKAFGINKGIMTTIHAYTADQRLQDAPHADLRRARAAAVNMIPTKTGAAVAVGKVLPHLFGKLDGMAIRVPIITGSVIDLVLDFQKDVTIDQINSAIKAAASDTLAYITDPIVSSDIIGSSYGSLYDAALTKEIENNGQKMFKLIAWYDNESSYVAQYVRTLLHFANL